MNVSADALADKNTGAQHYLVDVSIEGTLFENDGSEVIYRNDRVSGCFVGKRTVLDYFWQPMARTKSKL